MSVPVDSFGNQNQMNDDQDDAETETRSVVTRVIDPSFHLEHLPPFIVQNRKLIEENKYQGRRREKKMKAVYVTTEKTNVENEMKITKK